MPTENLSEKTTNYVRATERWAVNHEFVATALGIVALGALIVIPFHLRTLIHQVASSARYLIDFPA
jgi:hypothetical protein